jgi:hypothetical protein
VGVSCFVPKTSTAFFWYWILDDILVLQNHQLQSESAIGVPLDKQSSIHVQGRLSESPEVRERLERLVSESTKVISMLLASLVSVPLLLDFMAAYVMQ